VGLLPQIGPTHDVRKSETTKRKAMNRRRIVDDVDAAARQADASVPVFHDYSLSSDFER